MKNEILDSPIRQTLNDFLEKGETILWQGSPDYGTLENTFYFILLIASLFSVPLLSAYILGFPKDSLYTFYLIVIGKMFFWGIILSLNYSKQLQRKKTQYYITQKQILFQIKQSGKKQIHSIPFSEVKNYIIVNIDSYMHEIDPSQVIGTIFISVKNPKSIQVETFDFRTGESRSQPTLELIQEPEKLEKFLHEGIKNAKA